MDCGAYRMRDKYVIRIAGSEYTFEPWEYDDFFKHINRVMYGAEESMSDEYKELPEPAAPSGKGISLTGLFGIAKRTLGIVRRA